jgi:predicted dehydrogenase
MHRPSRRELLRLGIGSLALGSLAGAKSPNNRLRFAAIGVGGKGWSNIEAAAQFGDIVALCDIDQGQLQRCEERYRTGRTYSDFRKMLDDRHRSIDAVLVSTPDHTHAVAAAYAIRYGKAVYCEKPLTRTIWEARRLGELAKQMGVATQMGNQGTAGDGLRRAAAQIRAGMFGAVKEVHCWTDRPGGWWPQGIARPPMKEKPAHVDWDLWIGPSPFRDYADGYHAFAWRGWWDFGTGAMGDIACHCMNLPFAALDLRDPLSVQAQTSGHNRDSFPAWSIIEYQFGARGKRGPVKLVWYDGGKKPSLDLAPGLDQLPGNGCLIVCENATVWAPGEYANNVQVLGGEVEPGPVEFNASPGHMAEWVEAILGGRPAMSNFPNYAGPMTEMALVGNLAVWADGPKLEWDSRGMRVKGSREYDGLIRPRNRKGWENIL